ncbi:MAG: hypothetical protein C0482_23460 [Gordonia sp.]|nr:hypothetical protein [Gordonia sp. (in: high G+C Gram-positive bacteria)]
MTNDVHPTTCTAADLRYRLPRTYRTEWQYFTDWCLAFDLSALPASPLTVARFLGFEPDLTRRTLRRRVSAINIAHRTAGHTPPGTASAVRGLLSARDHQASVAQRVVERLPIKGWPGGLFGRRDALLLLLVCQYGIPVGTVGELRCGDITVDVATSTLRIGRGHDMTVPLDAANPYGAHAVWQRWATVRDLTLRRPSPTLWAPALHQVPARASATPVAWHEHHNPDAVLLPAFDRWGNPTAPIGDTTTGLSPRAVSAILRTHLRSTGRPVTDRTGWTRHAVERLARPPEPPAPVPVPDLDGTYDDGIDARRAAATELSDLDDIFDALDHQMAELLTRTEELLSHSDFQ